MHNIDLIIQSYFLSSRTPLGIWFMYLFTSIFNIIPFSLIIICFVILVYKKRGILYSLMLSVSSVSAAFLAWILKHITNVSRPEMAVILETDKSFPSGHTTMATVFFIMIAYIFLPRLKLSGKIFIICFSVVMILLVSFSRLYLGVHWFSDILAGWFLGIISSFVGINLSKYMLKLFGKEIIS